MVGKDRLKNLDLKNMEEYFQYIYLSKENGQTAQTRKLYNDLSAEQKTMFKMYSKLFMGNSKYVDFLEYID